MATISLGIKLYKNEEQLLSLMEIPELGGEAEAIEITTLTDNAHVYTKGLYNYGDSLAFKFLYEATQYSALVAEQDSPEEFDWKVELPDGTTCEFGGSYSVKLDGVGANAALTYTLNVKPLTKMVWATVEG